jgi:hypothetical protein
MASSQKAAGNLIRRNHITLDGSAQDGIIGNDIFETQWEELVISFDKERGEYLVRTAREPLTDELPKPFASPRR